MKKLTLFIEAGRREELISKFHKLGSRCISLETQTNVPLPDYVEVVKVKKWDDGGVEELKDILKEFGPNDLIVPCSCVAASKLAGIKTNDSGIFECSEKICYDKLKMQKLFYSKSYYPKAVEGITLIQKPRFGNGAKGIEKIFPSESSSLISYIEESKDSVFQRFIEGKEYSVDCFMYEGNLIEAVPRERLRVSNGEVIESITVEKPEIIGIVKDIINTFDDCKNGTTELNGPICMQFIEDKYGKAWLIEINHRFGGGATLSIEAGMNAPLWMLYPETIKNYKFGSYKRGLYLTRNYRDYYYET